MVKKENLGRNKIEGNVSITRLLVNLCALLGIILGATYIYVKDQSKIENNHNLILSNQKAIEKLDVNQKEKNEKFIDFTQKVLVSLSELKTDIKHLTKQRK